MNKNISNKNKKDWENFVNSKEKLPDKDLKFQTKKTIKTRSIDLHGYTLDEANKAIDNFIRNAFFENVNKLIVVTGKGLHSENEKDPYVSPLFAPNLSGLPPAIVITAGFDLLRDEAKAYADRLSEDGVETQYKEFMTEGHGFMYADTTASVRAANASIVTMFKPLL